MNLCSISKEHKEEGIVDALESMGINEGDTVRMYDLEFEYFR